MILETLPTSKPITARGFSLIELLVSMGIGLIITLAITIVLINNQKLQRTSTALNDASQSGAHAALTLDRATRSAGSGFTQFRQAMGCVLNASKGMPADQLLPLSTTLPSPFDNLGVAGLTHIVLAPAVIVAGGGANGSDQLVVMTGNHAFSETPLLIQTASATVNSVVVDNAMGLKANDIILVADQLAGSTCMIQQLGAAPVMQRQLSMAGDYFSSVGATRSLISFNSLPQNAISASVVPLGWMSNIAGTADNPPNFMVYGVGANEVLFSYDLLKTTGPSSPPVPVAEGIVGMYALYGVGSVTIPLSEVNPPATPQTPPVPLTWTRATGALSATTLWGATTQPAADAVRTNIQSIKAIRVALLLKSSVEEKPPVPPAPPVSPDKIVLFPDLPPALQTTVSLTPAQQNFRYRVVDTVIPIRNL